MLIFGLKSNDFSKRLKELVGRVDDQLKVEFLQNISLLLLYLGCRVLISTAENKLLHLRHLVGLLEFGSNVQGSYSNEL